MPILPTTLLKIALMGHPILSMRAEEIEASNRLEAHDLAQAMIATMEDAQGLGLSAPQVHVPWRLIVLAADQERPVSVLCNPVLEPLDADITEAWEGCLSIPGLRGVVPRYHRMRLKAQNLNGEPVESEVEGFHARVLQHEVDHLDGILYPQRMRNLDLLIYEDMLKYHRLASA